MVNVSTRIENGATIFMFNFTEDYNSDKSAIADESRISAILGYLNTGKFEKDIKEICDSRGYMTTDEEGILHRLTSKKPGEVIGNIEFCFNDHGISLHYISGMDYKDFAQMADLALRQNREMRKQERELCQSISAKETSTKK